jgi:hypothetical protein
MDRWWVLCDQAGETAHFWLHCVYREFGSICANG